MALVDRVVLDPHSDVSIIVGTFGDREWITLAQGALESARAQSTSPREVIHVHSDMLHNARNLGADVATSKHLIFLDADDTLDIRYVEAMKDMASRLFARSDHKTWLIQPATLGVYPDGREDAETVVIPKKDLSVGNYMVIGTMVEREQFLRVGGFDDWPYAEDWDLWIRCVKDGAGTVPQPEAIYRVMVRDDGRNSCDAKLMLDTYHAIRNKHFS